MALMAKRRLSLYLFAAVLTAALCSSMAFAKSSQLFKLVASPGTATISANEPVPVVLTLTNLSQKEGFVSKTNDPEGADLDYKLRVFDSKGLPVSFTEHGKSLMHRAPLLGASRFVFLRQGEDLIQSIDIESIFTLIPGHTYKVSFSRFISASGAADLVKSNWIIVCVQQPNNAR